MARPGFVGDATLKFSLPKDINEIDINHILKRTDKRYQNNSIKYTNEDIIKFVNALTNNKDKYPYWRKNILKLDEQILIKYINTFTAILNNSDERNLEIVNHFNEKSLEKIDDPMSVINLISKKQKVIVNRTIFNKLPNIEDCDLVDKYLDGILKITNQKNSLLITKIKYEIVKQFENLFGYEKIDVVINDIISDIKPEIEKAIMFKKAAVNYYKFKQIDLLFFQSKAEERAERAIKQKTLSHYSMK